MLGSCFSRGRCRTVLKRVSEGIPGFVVYRGIQRDGLLNNTEQIDNFIDINVACCSDLLWQGIKSILL